MDVDILNSIFSVCGGEGREGKGETRVDVTLDLPLSCATSSSQVALSVLKSKASFKVCLLINIYNVQKIPI